MKKSGTVCKAWGWLPPSWKHCSHAQPPMAQQPDQRSEQEQQSGQPPPAFKHKLCRWKDSWTRDSQQESNVNSSLSEVSQQQRQPQEKQGSMNRAKRIAVSPDGAAGGHGPGHNVLMMSRELVEEAETGLPGDHPGPNPGPGAMRLREPEILVARAPVQAEPRGMRVTVVRHKRNRQVLFVEAGKEFVDVVLGLLALPGWAVLRVLKSDSRPSPSLHLSSSGCIQNLYESVREMDPAVFLTDKSNLLMGEGALSCFLPSLLYLSAGMELQVQRVRRSGPASIPETSSDGAAAELQLAVHGGDVDASAGTEFIYGCYGRYVANGIHGPGHQPCPWIAWEPGTKCPSCGNIMTMLYGEVESSKKRKRPSHNSKRRVTQLPGAGGSDHIPEDGAAALAVAPPPLYGAVKENVIFMLTDALEVFPTSGNRSLELLSRKRWLITDLEKVSLELGHFEVKKLMELSLTSETVLTDILTPLMR